MSSTSTTTPDSPKPPFTRESAERRVRLAEAAWNSKDPARVALGYSEETTWRNRTEFLEGRDAVRAFLARKWEKELD